MPTWATRPLRVAGRRRSPRGIATFWNHFPQGVCSQPEGKACPSLYGQYDRQVGTRLSSLQAESQRMFQWAKHNLLSIRSEHILGLENTMTQQEGAGPVGVATTSPCLPIPSQDIQDADSGPVCVSHQHSPPEIFFQAAVAEGTAFTGQKDC